MQNGPKSEEVISRIKRLMQKMDLNQRAMARICQISPVVLNHYLTGRRNPSVEMLAKIVTGAQEAGLEWVTMDWMVFAKNVPKSWAWVTQSPKPIRCAWWNCP